MVSFPSSLRAEYTELINEKLDHIPMQNFRDFAIVIEALKSITKPNRGHNVPLQLQDRITSIIEMRDEPELYVENEANYQEFKKIIMDRVAAKIHELTLMTVADIFRYISFQRRERILSAENHTLMKQAHPPAEGSDAHTVTEEQWLRELARQFTDEQDREPEDSQEIELARRLLFRIRNFYTELDQRPQPTVSPAPTVLSQREITEAVDTMSEILAFITSRLSSLSLSQ